MTQKEFSAKIGLSPVSLSRIVNLRVRPQRRTAMAIAAAAAQTGYTVWQLRGLIKRDEIRHCKHGKLVRLHPEDVNALAARVWAGKAVTA